LIIYFFLKFFFLKKKKTSKDKNVTLEEAANVLLATPETDEAEYVVENESEILMEVAIMKENDPQIDSTENLNPTELHKSKPQLTPSPITKPKETEKKSTLLSPLIN